MDHDDLGTACPSCGNPMQPVETVTGAIYMRCAACGMTGV